MAKKDTTPTEEFTEEKKRSKYSQEDIVHIRRESDLIFYDALVNRWFDSRREVDKSLFALSTGGIGVLVTLIQLQEPQSAWEAIPGILALASFLITIISVINIFRRDSKRIAAALKSRKDLAPDELDSIAYNWFLSGVVFSILYAVATIAT